ncbi:MAG TPA: 2-phospho-L-lactate guanylyltransferase [Acidobacteriota bacterium]|nr:2-phospho-L-lactate guanylyltransferase [Acidobacteriota bacterium]
MSTIILVPVKKHENAKSRLSKVLTNTERAMLARTMFDDVAAALINLNARVAVVTDSDETAQRARRLGWRTLRESRQISESVSVDAASAQLRREGVGAVLRLPADLPLVTAADLEQILTDCPPAPFAVLVPSCDRMGTNAILRKPPDLFPSRFGPNSFILHQQEAKRSQAAFRIVENYNIGLDIDNARDLRRFLDRSSETLTYHLLRKLGIKERLCETDSA